MSIPVAPTDEIYPAYQDLVNNWRSVDVHWLRDRTTQVFDTAAERDGPPPVYTPRPGMVSYLKIHPTDASEPGGSLEFYTPAGWESVRYPNLKVTSDSTSVTLRRLGAGSGIMLRTNGTVDIATLFAGSGGPTGPGTTLDSTGISLRVGTRTVKFATNATQLTVDSPVLVTGDIESTTTLRAPALAITGNLTAVNASLTGTLTVPNASVSGTVATGLLRAGLDADVTVDTGLAVFRNRQSTANRLSFSATGAAVLTGSTVTVNGAITAINAATFQGATTFRLVPTINPAGQTASPVAGVIAMNRAPTGSDNYANGTIWFHI